MRRGRFFGCFFLKKLEASEGRCRGGRNGGLGSLLFATYGRSLLRPTVGRIDDLPWVVKATHSGFLFAPSKGRWE